MFCDRVLHNLHLPLRYETRSRYPLILQTFQAFSHILPHAKCFRGTTSTATCPRIGLCSFGPPNTDTVILPSPQGLTAGKPGPASPRSYSWGDNTEEIAALDCAPKTHFSSTGCYCGRSTSYLPVVFLVSKRTLTLLAA